jgi:hypothetical protein
MRTLEGIVAQIIQLTLEIEEMFEKKVPTRKWTTYVTQGVSTAVDPGEFKGGVGAHAEEIEDNDV